MVGNMNELCEQQKQETADGYNREISQEKKESLLVMSQNIQTTFTSIFSMISTAEQMGDTSQKMKDCLFRLKTFNEYLLVSFEDLFREIQGINANRAEDKEFEGKLIDNIAAPFRRPAEDGVILDKKRVLVAVNTQEESSALKEILSSYGASVDEALDDEEAIQMYSMNESGFYDLIVLTYDIKQSLGLEVATKMQVLFPENSKVPILLIVDDTDQWGEINVSESDIDALMVKPIEPKRLVKKLTRLLKRVNRE